MEEIASGGATRKAFITTKISIPLQEYLSLSLWCLTAILRELLAFRVCRRNHDILPGEPRQIYDLYMHNDVNTTQNTQWFYFGVSNMKAGTTVTFFIRNYSKPDSMFNEGMRPLLYSAKSNRGWVRAAFDICYFYCPSTELDVTQQQQQPTGNSSATLPQAIQVWARRMMGAARS